MSTTIIDWSVLESIAPGNSKIANHLLSVFLEDGEKSKAELTHAMQSGDLRSVCICAHALSGAARSLGAGTLADAARTLEQTARAQAPCEQPWQELQRALDAVTRLVQARLASGRE